jgi:hypothetical protein
VWEEILRRSQNNSLLQAEKAAEVSVSNTPEAVKIREFAGVQYQLEPDGKDAILVNGRFSNKKVSEVVTTVEGRDFLGGLWRMIPPDLQNIVRHQFGK